MDKYDRAKVKDLLRYFDQQKEKFDALEAEGFEMQVEDISTFRFSLTASHADGRKLDVSFYDDTYFERNSNPQLSVKEYAGDKPLPPMPDAQAFLAADEARRKAEQQILRDSHVLKEALVKDAAFIEWKEKWEAFGYKVFARVGEIEFDPKECRFHANAMSLEKGKVRGDFVVSRGTAAPVFRWTSGGSYGLSANEEAWMRAIEEGTQNKAAPPTPEQQAEEFRQRAQDATSLHEDTIIQAPHLSPRKSVPQAKP